jgi:hypothetical protein
MKKRARQEEIHKETSSKKMRLDSTSYTVLPVQLREYILSYLDANHYQKLEWIGRELLYTNDPFASIKVPNCFDSMWELALYQTRKNVRGKIQQSTLLAYLTRALKEPQLVNNRIFNVKIIIPDDIVSLPACSFGTWIIRLEDYNHSIDDIIHHFVKWVQANKTFLIHKNVRIVLPIYDNPEIIVIYKDTFTSLDLNRVSFKASFSCDTDLVSHKQLYDCGIMNRIVSLAVYNVEKHGNMCTFLQSIQHLLNLQRLRYLDLYVQNEQNITDLVHWINKHIRTTKHICFNGLILNNENRHALDMIQHNAIEYHHWDIVHHQETLESILSIKNLWCGYIRLASSICNSLLPLFKKFDIKVLDLGNESEYQPVLFTRK